MLRDGLVQAADGYGIIYLSGADVATASKATPKKRAEFEKLFTGLCPASPNACRWTGGNFWRNTRFEPWPSGSTSNHATGTP